MKKKLLLLSVTLIGLAVLVMNSLTSQQSVSPQNVAAAELRWRAGTSQQYQVNTDSSIRMDIVNAGSAQSMRVQLTCMLDLHTLEAGADSALVGMQLSAIDLQIGGKTDPATIQAMSTPFRVRFVSGGMPASFEFPAGISAKNRSILENLIRMFQVTVRSGNTWIAQEADVSGRYEAMYQRTSAHDISKSKRNLTGQLTTSVVNDTAISSNETIRLDEHNDWLREMTLEETRNTKDLADVNVVIRNTATLVLTSSNQYLPGSTWDFVAAAAQPESEQQNAQKLNISPEQARRQMKSALQSLDSETEGRSLWIHQLRDLLRADDSLSQALLAELKTGQLSDRTQADVYLAFELAGTKAAQQALISVVSDTSWSKRDAMRAIVALAGVEQPIPDVFTVLWDTAENPSFDRDSRQLASTATYALGSLGDTLNRTQDPEYSALKSRLQQGAFSYSSSAEEIERRTSYVYALGNTRDAALTDDLTKLLNDGAPSIRRAAALSLNTIGVDPSAEKLVSRFSQESNRSVRSAIAESLVNWSTPSRTAVSAVAAEIRTEPHEGTRYHMAQFLGNHLDKYPDTRAILQELLRHEQSQRIRQSVANALASNN